MVYDVTSAESFGNVQRWLREIDTNCESVARVLVGNKDDDPSKKVVQRRDAEMFARASNITLYETSAKENKNVETMFAGITQLVLELKLAQQMRSAPAQASQQQQTVKLTSQGDRQQSAKKKSCCK